jgi:hypothetical protein
MAKYDVDNFVVAFSMEEEEVKKLYFYLYQGKIGKLNKFQLIALATTKEQALVNLMAFLEEKGIEEVKFGYYENVSEFLADNINKYLLKEIEI